MNPSLPEDVYQLFIALWAARDPEECSRYLEEAEKRLQDLPVIRGHLAFYYLNHGNPSRALDLYEEIARQVPDSDEVRRGKADALVQLHRIPESASLYRQILRKRHYPARLEVEVNARDIGALTRWLEWDSSFCAEVAAFFIRHPHQAWRALREMAGLYRYRRNLAELRPYDWYVYLRYYAEQGVHWPILECDLCGSAENQTVYLNTVNRIVRCESCGLLRALRIPPEGYDVTVGIYQSSDSREKLVVHYDDPSYRLQRGEVIDQFLSEIHGDSGLDRLRVFEIGAARADTLALLRDRGWEVDGIECDEEFIRMASSLYGIALRRGALGEVLKLPPGGYDAVLAFHVIEHLDRPSRLFEAARHLLKPEGILILETPGTRQLEVCYATRRHPLHGLMAAGHTYFLTEETLERYLERCGFDRITSRIVEFGRGVSNITISGRPRS